METTEITTDRIDRLTSRLGKLALAALLVSLWVEHERSPLRRARL